MFFEYLREREGIEAIVHEHAFVTYTVENGDLYARDLFIEPNYRQSEALLQLWAELKTKARELQCERILGSVDVRANNPHISLKVLLKLGFIPHAATDSVIWLHHNLEKD